MKSLFIVIGTAVVLSGCANIQTTCQGNDVDGWDCEGKTTTTSTSTGDARMTVTVQAKYEQKIVIDRDGKTVRTLTGAGVGSIYDNTVPAGTYSANGYWRESRLGGWQKSDGKVSKRGNCTVHAFDDKGPLSEVDFNDIVMTICPK